MRALDHAVTALTHRFVWESWAIHPERVLPHGVVNEHPLTFKASKGALIRLLLGSPGGSLMFGCGSLFLFQVLKSLWREPVRGLALKVERLLKIWVFNSLRCGEWVILPLLTAMCSHDCSPNAFWNFDLEQKIIELRAGEHIQQAHPADHWIAPNPFGNGPGSQWNRVGTGGPRPVEPVVFLRTAQG